MKDDGWEREQNTEPRPLLEGRSFTAKAIFWSLGKVRFTGKMLRRVLAEAWSQESQSHSHGLALQDQGNRGCLASTKTLKDSTPIRLTLVLGSI